MDDLLYFSLILGGSVSCHQSIKIGIETKDAVDIMPVHRWMEQ